MWYIKVNVNFLGKNVEISLSNFNIIGIDLHGLKYCVISISAEISAFAGGAKEVQNFKLKVHSGPEGSRGWHLDRKYSFAIEII